MAELPPESIIQQTLKKVLELTITIAKQRLKSKPQLQQLQSILIDYSSTEELTIIIEKVLLMIVHLPDKNKTLDESIVAFVDEAEYIKLEETLQKYQSLVRNHIKNQQQFKLYCEELQGKIKDLEKSNLDLVISTKSTILDLKRQNQQLISKCKKLSEQISELKTTEKRRSSLDVIDEKREKLNGRNGSHKSLRKSQKDQLPKPQSSLRSRLEQYTKVIEQIDLERGRKGSAASIKGRQKKI